MKRSLLILMVILAFPSISEAAGTCKSFSTWQEAQRAFDDNSLLHKGLDRDKDGWACEDNCGLRVEWRKMAKNDQMRNPLVHVAR